MAIAKSLRQIKRAKDCIYTVFDWYLRDENIEDMEDFVEAQKLAINLLDGEAKILEMISQTEGQENIHGIAFTREDNSKPFEPVAVYDL